MLMRIKPGSYETREWKPWLAWYPVATIDGYIIWFDWVGAVESLPAQIQDMNIHS